MKNLSRNTTEVIANFRNYRDKMLKALDYHAVPLHHNGSEQSIREMVKKRDVCGSTPSEEGQKFRDGLVIIKRTWRKLGVSLYHSVSQHFQRAAPNLSKLVRRSYPSSC
jgi:hypothetical protein